jgi:hypothetical protein
MNVSCNERIWVRMGERRFICRAGVYALVVRREEQEEDENKEGDRCLSGWRVCFGTLGSNEGQRGMATASGFDLMLPAGRTAPQLLSFRLLFLLPSFYFITSSSSHPGVSSLFTQAGVTNAIA